MRGPHHVVKLALVGCVGGEEGYSFFKAVHFLQILFQVV